MVSPPESPLPPNKPDNLCSENLTQLHALAPLPLDKKASRQAPKARRLGRELAAERGQREGWVMVEVEIIGGALIFHIAYIFIRFKGNPWWLSGKESACYAGAVGSIPRLGRSPGGGNGKPLQYSCLENPMDRGTW